MRRRVADGRARADARGALLESYSFARVLERGFALVGDADGRPVTSRAQAVAAGAVALRFGDGSVAARVEGDAPVPGRPRGDAS
jgi:exodeoxyribonuclease VII large subunit